MNGRTDTIVAPATPPGRGGIGIVRVSGPGTRLIATAILGRLPAPRHATVSVFSDSGGHTLDVGLALYFPAPDSFTGEDVLVIGSGHVTHNLRDWMGSRGANEALPYAASFAGWLADTLAKHDDDALLAYREQGPGGARAHPSEEHFLPIYVAWGAAGHDAVATRVYQGFDGPALSMDAYAFAAPDALQVQLPAHAAH